MISNNYIMLTNNINTNYIINTNFIIYNKNKMVTIN